MAEFILRHSSPNPPAWMKIEKETVKWVGDASEASPFPTEAEARAALNEAKAAMLVKAQIKLQRDLAAGKTVKNKYSYQGQTRAPVLSDYALKWTLDPHFRAVTESRATQDDLLGVLELWFVRGNTGWLGMGRDRRLEFHESFHNAAPFLSLEAAQAGLEKSWWGASQNCSFIRGSMAFSQVVPKNENMPMDPQSQGIAAACEAREIGAEIQASAQARLADLKAAAPRPKSRL